VPSPEKLASVVETSLKQTDRLANLVEDLLDVSRIQAGKLEFNFEEMDLAHLIQEVEDQQCEQLEGTKCPIHVHITDDLKPHWDRSRIEQVVANLVSNSLKYAPDSPIRIEAFLQENNITLSVQDSGPGISKENQLRIFERFERATTSRNISGLGLGLYIVNQIVKGHQGSIRVESEQGLGTKFIIEMPVFPFRIRMESNGNSIG
jgi:signal transduction histidine kinase